MKMMSGVGGVKSDNNVNGMTGEDDDYAKPKAFTDKKELQNAQDDIDNESDEER